MAPTPPPTNETFDAFARRAEVEVAGARLTVTDALRLLARRISHGFQLGLYGPCPTCCGSGLERGRWGPGPCDRCDGTGYVYVAHTSDNGEPPHLGRRLEIDEALRGPDAALTVFAAPLGEAAADGVEAEELAAPFGQFVTAWAREVMRIRAAASSLGMLLRAAEAVIQDMSASQARRGVADQPHEPDRIGG
ncbi:hypothetical protein HRbin39_01583 [bacterium HR39]|nr:hypothetical protein HRbin39_01583 [bacterium HR39]